MPKPRHVHETYIQTTPERLWQALTESTDTRRYFFACDFDGPLVVGRPYRMTGHFGPAVDGTVVELDAPRKLVVTFHVLFDEQAASEDPTKVTWEIAAVREGVCRLSLVHEDFGGLSKTWSITLTGWRVVIDGLKTLLETGEPIGEIPDDRAADEIVPVDLTAEEHRTRGIEIFNDTWRIMGLDPRTAEDDEAMIRSAYASAYHWSMAARRTIANDARGEWLLSRVHVLAGRGETALHHAQRCMAAVREGGLVDFDLGYAHEALARSLALLGRTDEAAAELAAALAVEVVDPEDRQIYDADLVSEPWFGVALTSSVAGARDGGGAS